MWTIPPGAGEASSGFVSQPGFLLSSERARVDKLTRYRQIVRAVLEEFAAWAYKPGKGVRGDVLYDSTRDAFVLVECGWDGRRRMNGLIYHVELIDGQVWVQFDATNRPIAQQLARAGISREDIILGEKPPELWKDTDYGVPRGAGAAARA